MIQGRTGLCDPCAPVSDLFIGAVAQLGEHLLCKQGVDGSIPFSSTKSCSQCRVDGAERSLLVGHRR